MKQTDYLYMFMELTFAIYFAGAGAVLLGALYWRRATTAGAWAAMIIGPFLATVFLIMKTYWPELKMPYFNITLNGLHYTLIACISALISYIVVSLCTPNPHFDLDNLLGRKPKETKTKKA